MDGDWSSRAMDEPPVERWRLDGAGSCSDGPWWLGDCGGKEVRVEAGVEGAEERWRRGGGSEGLFSGGRGLGLEEEDKGVSSTDDGEEGMIAVVWGGFWERNDVAFWLFW